MKRLPSLALPLLLTTLVIVLAGCGGPSMVERMSNGFLGYGICGSVLLILDIIALVQIAGTNWSIGRKAVWALLIIFFPVGGLLLWWFFGK
jgi:phospholipase D-like protein